MEQKIEEQPRDISYEWENSKDKSRLVSYFIRWAITQVVKTQKKSKNAKNPVLIETGKYIEFIPQLNDAHVANHSMLKIHDPFSFGCANNKLRFIKDKTIHLLSSEMNQYPQPVHGIMCFSTSRITKKQILEWLNITSGKIAVIFPYEHERHFERLMFETLSPHQGPIRLDYLYHGKDETFGKWAHDFIRQKFGTPLSVADFEFLSLWTYAIFSIKPQHNPDKKTKETKESD